MTAKELVEKLSALPPATEVVVENMYGEWVEPRIIDAPGSPGVVVILDSK